MRPRKGADLSAVGICETRTNRQIAAGGSTIDDLERVIVAFVVDHIDERESIARSNGVIKVQDTLIIVNGGGGRGDKFVDWAGSAFGT